MSHRINFRVVDPSDLENKNREASYHSTEKAAKKAAKGNRVIQSMRLRTLKEYANGNRSFYAKLLRVRNELTLEATWAFPEHFGSGKHGNKAYCYGLYRDD